MTGINTLKSNNQHALQADQKIKSERQRSMDQQISQVLREGMATNLLTGPALERNDQVL